MEALKEPSCKEKIRNTLISQELAVVTLEMVGPQSRIDRLFPMFLGVGCLLVGAGSSAQDWIGLKGTTLDRKN